MDRIICVVGPTASGKTKLAVQLAKLYDGEVVSCDSMQIYKHMDIGTAKPTKEEMEGVAHHLIDMVEPGEDFSAGKYVQLADACVQDILSRGKTAVIAGGTGLYVDSLIAGRSFAPVPQTGRREALEAQHGAFPPLMISLFRSGEASGKMDQAAKKVGLHYQKEHKIRSKIKSAMIYPAILIVVAILVFFGVFVFILPQFLASFQSLGVEMPGITRAMMAISQTLIVHWAGGKRGSARPGHCAAERRGAPEAGRI